MGEVARSSRSRVKGVSWAAAARNDLRDARDYLRSVDPELFRQIVWKAVETARFLAEHPEAGTAVKDGTRRKWRIGKTPYIILYGVRKDELRILRVIHAARDWRRFL